MSLPRSEVRVVLFDVGGVLVQLNGVATILDWTGNRWDTQELWRIWLHSPAVRAFETGRMDPETFAADLLRELDISIDATHFIESFTAWPTGLYPGALDLIARIPGRYTRALLSNSNVLHWPRVIGDMGLGAVFQHQFSSHLTGKIKPDRAAFEHVVSELRCEAGAVLFLDDNLINVEAARAAGMQAEVAAGIAGAERVLQQAGILR